MRPSSIVDAFTYRSARAPDAVACIFLDDGETEHARITYGELDRLARGMAAVFGRKASRGSRVLLLLPSGIGFIGAFLGCLYSGTIAVPALPPRPGARRRRDSRFAAITANAGCALAVVEGRSSEAAELLFANTGVKPDLVIVEEVQPHHDGGFITRVESQDIAFLQYTSGSTACPRGVMVTHGNLLHNERVIQAACGHDELSTFVGWTPLYHDLGLLGNVLQPLFTGATAVLMPPTAFLLKPVNWLQAISRYRAHTSGGPNFAYELCCDRITVSDCAGLDLSSWRVAFNGAEPVQWDSMERFASKFERYGYSRSASFPCYGLAEGTLMATASDSATPPVSRTVSSRALERRQVVPADLSRDEATRVVVSCGRPLLDQQLRIVDPDVLTPCEVHEVGEIWLASNSIAAGYWNAPAETSSCFGLRLPDSSASWLRTGDLGFVSNGELFVTGRIKDVIIIRGRNYDAHELELTAERADSRLPKHANAAFSMEGQPSERLVIVQEIDAADRSGASALVDAIRAAVALAHGVLSHTIVLVRRGGVPRTTSGKIQRGRCRQLWTSGVLPVIHADTLTQTPNVPDISRQPLSTMDGADRVEFITAYLVRQVAQCTGIRESRIDTERGLGAAGVDSLGCAQLKQRLEADLQLAADVNELMSAVSIGRLAARLAARPSLSEQPGAGFQPVWEAALSPDQLRLWMIERHQSRTRSIVHTIAASVPFGAPADAADIRCALDEIVRRHTALRVAMTIADGAPVQRIARSIDVTVRLHVIDLRGMGGRARHCIDVARDYGPSLVSLPKLRAILFLMPNGPSELLLAVHHIVSDAWSIGVIMRDLFRRCRHLPAADLPSVGGEGSRFLSEMRRRSTVRPSESVLAYWRHDLADLQAPLRLALFPNGKTRPRSEKVRRDIRNGTLERLRALARSQGVTPFAIVLAAFRTALQRICSQDDLIIAVPLYGRDRRVEDEVGFFAYLVPVRVRASQEGTVSDLLAATHGAVQRAQQHQMSFADIVGVALPQGHDAIRGLAQVILSHLRLPQAWADDGVPIDDIEVHSDGLATDVFATVLETDDGMRITITAVELLSGAGALLDELLYLIAAFAVHPGGQVRAM